MVFNKNVLLYLSMFALFLVFLASVKFSLIKGYDDGFKECCDKEVLIDSDGKLVCGYLDRPMDALDYYFENLNRSFGGD